MTCRHEDCGFHHWLRRQRYPQRHLAGHRGARYVAMAYLLGVLRR